MTKQQKLDKAVKAAQIAKYGEVLTNVNANKFCSWANATVAEPAELTVTQSMNNAPGHVVKLPAGWRIEMKDLIIVNGKVKVRAQDPRFPKDMMPHFGTMQVDKIRKD